MILQNSDDEQQTFYNACISGDYDLKQSYHEQYYHLTLETLKKHVDDTIDVINDLSLLSWLEFSRRYPRLPLLESHNEFVFDIFDLVQQKLETA